MTENTDHDEAAPDDHSDASGEHWREPPIRPDGGADAAGADDVALDPWGSSTVADYRKLFEQFGIEEFDE
ncbi:MAG: tryptophan--tRNA ligase, partial [Haloarculaceae archaeon]